MINRKSHYYIINVWLLPNEMQSLYFPMSFGNHNMLHECQYFFILCHYFNNKIHKCRQMSNLAHKTFMKEQSCCP